MKNLIILIFIFFATQALGENKYIGRSIEGLLMGDAFTAVADDTSTLFYNPAALSRHSGVSIYAVNVAVQFPDIVDINWSIDNFSVGFADRYSDIPDDTVGIAESFLGEPIYFQLGSTPTIKMENFGMTLLANSKTNIVLENAIHPSLEVDSRYDRGFIAGYAFNFNKRPKRGKTYKNLSLGFAIKHINREATKGSFALFSQDVIDLTENMSDISDIKSVFGSNSGKGWGLDTGLEFQSSLAGHHLILGASLQNIGDLRFKTADGSSVAKQDMSLTFGSSIQGGTRTLGYTFALDYGNVFDNYHETASLIRFGSRFQLPIVDFFLGWNGGYISYGFGIDIWIFRMNLGFYGVEVGNSFKHREGERTILSFDLLNIHYDL